MGTLKLDEIDERADLRLEPQTRCDSGREAVDACLEEMLVGGRREVGGKMDVGIHGRRVF